jgi:hypothetical protein
MNSKTTTSRRGRPEKDPHDIMDRLKLGLMWQQSLAKACNRVGINRKTVYNLIKRHPWMQDEIDRYHNMITTLGPELLHKEIECVSFEQVRPLIDNIFRKALA